MGRGVLVLVFWQGQTEQTAPASNTTGIAPSYIDSTEPGWICYSAGAIFWETFCPLVIQQVLRTCSFLLLILLSTSLDNIILYF